MNRFNQKFWTYCFGVAIAAGLSLWFGSVQNEINRVPAQNNLDNPFGIVYSIPLDSCAKDGESCNQANDCHSALCLRGACVARYFSNQKASPGEYCNSPDQCFSAACDTVAQKCIGSNTNLCAYVEQYCNADEQCCSNSCDTSRNRCVGSPSKECGTVGTSCGSPGECCSAVCAVDPSAPISGTSPASNRCLGSSLDPGMNGDVCNANAQCSSNICHNQHCI